MNSRTQKIAALAVMVILIAAAFYLLVLERPIKAPPEKIVLTVADLPPGWIVNSTRTYNCHNISEGYARGGEGWNCAVDNIYQNITGEETWNLWIIVFSYNSSGLAHDRYAGWSGSVETPHIHPKLGDEAIQVAVFNAAGGVDWVGYILREANVLISISIRNGGDIGSVEPWMDGIANLQAAKLHQNNLF